MVAAVLVKVAAKAVVRAEAVKETAVEKEMAARAVKETETERGMAKETERVLAVERICLLFLPTTGT